MQLSMTILRALGKGVPASATLSVRIQTQLRIKPHSPDTTSVDQTVHGLRLEIEELGSGGGAVSFTGRLHGCWTLEGVPVAGLFTLSGLGSIWLTSPDRKRERIGAQQRPDMTYQQCVISLAASRWRDDRVRESNHQIDRLRAARPGQLLSEVTL